MSIGEGHSGLTPFLRRNGAKAAGLDLASAYSVTADESGKVIDSRENRYMERYKHHLVIGNALKLDEAVEKNSQDLILSHAVFGYFERSDDKGATVVSGAFRALKKGGTLYFDLGGHKKDDYYVAKVKEWIKNLPKGSYDISIQRGTSHILGATVEDAKECYRPDSLSRKDFEDTLNHFAAREKKEKGEVTWPFGRYDKDTIVIAIRKK